MSIGKTVKKTIYGILLVSFFLVCLMLSVSFAAGDVAGFIRNHDGTPISGLYVYALNPSTNAWVMTSSSSGTDGSYTISGLTAGNYKVQFSGTVDYAQQYYLNATNANSATQITVPEGGTRTDVNFNLISGGAISGTIASGGSARSGLTVTAYDAATGANIKNSSSSDTFGAYTISGLPPGSYRVVFFGDGTYARQYYNNAANTNTSAIVIVTAGSTATNINFSLVQGGNIQGTITGTSGVSGITVNAYDATDNTFIKNSSTNSSGVYTVYGLLPGSYKLQAGVGNGAYVSQYYPNAADISSATPVTVTAGGTTSNTNFSLITGASITGTITAASTGDFLSGININVSNVSNAYSKSTASNGSGVYTISGLPAGSYKIQFSGNATYATQYYNNAINSNEATWVTVAEGGTASGIDLSLIPGTAIQGTITRAYDGEPASGISVCAMDAVTGMGCFGSNSASDATGMYRVYGLPDGSYKLRVNSSNTGLAVQYYSSAPNLNTATPVTVAGVLRTGIDFSLVAGGTITGTITRASDGLPVSGVTVSATDPVTFMGVTSTSSSSATDGSYTIWGLAPGSYKVRANTGNTGLAVQWYDNTDMSGAIPVTVTADANTPGVNFNLQVGGSISGIVTSTSGGQPIPNLNVNAFSVEENGSTAATGFGGTTQYDGSYTITGLSAGIYVVSVNTISGYYATQFYLNARTNNTAVHLTVTAGANTPGVNFSLDAGGKISGTARDAETHLPLAGIGVRAYHAETGEFVGSSAWTNTNGEYTTMGLPAGNYRLSTNFGSNYIDVWYDNASLNAASTPVAVTAGVTTPGVDFNLSSGAGTITGTVRDSGNQPLADIGVAVYNALGRVKNALTAVDGSYSIPGLTAGNTYTVSVEPRNQGYAGVFYPDALTQATATLITIGAGQTTPNVNFNLNAGGSISGVVTSTTAVPLPGMRVTASDWTSKNSMAGSATTQYDGSYKFTGLPAGTYIIKVTMQLQDPNNQYVAQYYNNTARGDLATSVSVTTGATTENINFSLPLGGKISGMVRSAANNDPIPALQVRAYDTSGNVFAAICLTTYDGSYVLTGLPAGSYVVQVRGTGSSFASRYYNGVTDIAFATPVSVSVGNTTPGINLNLLPAGIKNDFNSDGKPDLFWRNPTTGENVVYYMDGVNILGGVYLQAIDPAWILAGIADLNADGKPDLLWRNPVTGENVVYYMDGVTIQSGVYLPTIDPVWTLSGTADLNGDGKPDLLWRNPATGENVVYYMDGASILSGAYLPTIDSSWTLSGTADLNADGKPDLLWRNPVTGENVIYYMDGTTIVSGVYLPAIDPAWTLAGTADLNADGKPDLLWRNPVTGENVVYYMNGIIILSGTYLPTIDPAWTLAGH
jgi:hypothetical protein